MTVLAVEHRPNVIPRGARRVMFVGTCTCGWKASKERHTREMAHEDADDHVRARCQAQGDDDARRRDGRRSAVLSGGDTSRHLAELARLRADRTRLEAEFMRHPTRMAALGLAQAYENLRDEVLAAVGLELDDDGEEDCQ